MIIYPAIDIKEGSCVRLIQGDKNQKTVYSEQPEQVALDFQKKGAEYIHVVDLDGAFEGRPKNLEIIQKIARSISIPFQVGGGLRSLEDVERVLDMGASRVIIGTKAVSSPTFIQELIEKFGSDKIILGVDARNGKVAVEGWVESTEISAIDFTKQMRELGIKETIFTDISRDGLLKGPNFESIENMAKATQLKIIASGGVSSIENIIDLKQMESIGVSGAIIGKALYDGKFSLEEALVAASK